MMLRFYVKGGKLSNGKHGWVFSNANWDPYPLATDVESLSIALGNMDIAVMLRQAKFGSTFFTVISPRDVNVQAGFGGGGSNKNEVMQHIQSLMMPLAPEGYSTDIQQVEELDSQAVLKVVRARDLVAETMQLLAMDLTTGALWMDVRKAQDPARSFGAAPTAAWAAFRKVMPLTRTGPDAPAQAQPAPTVALQFLMDHPAVEFYPAGPAMPDAAPVKTVRK
jgi:histidine ammonia-lyase